MSQNLSQQSYGQQTAALDIPVPSGVWAWLVVGNYGNGIFSWSSGAQQGYLAPQQAIAVPLSGTGAADVLLAQFNSNASTAGTILSTAYSQQDMESGGFNPAAFPQSLTATEVVATGFVNPMTSIGDLIIGGAGGAPQRLGVGTNGQVLGSDGTDPGWVSGGAGSSLIASQELAVAAPSVTFSAIPGTPYKSLLLNFVADASAANGPTADTTYVLMELNGAALFIDAFGFLTLSGPPPSPMTRAMRTCLKRWR